MPDTFQEWATCIVVALAIVDVALRVRRVWFAPAAPGCGGCRTCSANRNSPTPQLMNIQLVSKTSGQRNKV